VPDALVTLQLRLPDVDQVAGRAWLADLLAEVARRPGPAAQVQGHGVAQTEWATDGLTALLVRHRHGQDLSLHPSHDGAKAALVAYVRYWWTDELPDEPEPADDGEAITRYFDRLEDEDYQIEPVALQPAPDPIDGQPLRGRCQVCGRQLTNQGDGLWLHNWSQSNNCDPAGEGVDDETPRAVPTWLTPTCRRCRSPLSPSGTCTAPTCPYAHCQQYQVCSDDQSF
jgi:hypothetical protein